ncbi:RHS repeat-associated core domain-containing protein [Streptomyces sp. NPDC013157]|uniref:RHS repeat-associated core domain-containing protein n=1 Tax=Streptomyces sp. NPDC013157 TaxID=3364861 RepID=UPI003674F29F
MAGVLGATTSASGSVTLQLADLHGDIAVTLATATTTATAYSYDEYGNTTNTSRYGWLGTAQWASDTPTGVTLMGQRLYSPEIGRFLQTDPIQNGSATAHDYCNGDPVNCTDINTSLRVYEGIQHQQSWSQVLLKIAIGAILVLVAPVIVLLVIRARNRKKNSSPALDDDGIETSLLDDDRHHGPPPDSKIPRPVSVAAGQAAPSAWRVTW